MKSVVRRSTPVWHAIAAAAVLAGCASKVPLNEPTEKAAPVQQMPAPAPAPAATPVAPVQAPQPDAAADAANRVVYFDYDSYIVKDEFKPVIEANARALTANAGKRVTLEGHTDERGGSEYNLALGQKRAQAVAKALSLLGVKGEQMEAVSFGKERPAAEGHDEAAWAKNRRVEVKDR